MDAVHRLADRADHPDRPCRPQPGLRHLQLGADLDGVLRRRPAHLHALAGADLPDRRQLALLGPCPDLSQPPLHDGGDLDGPIDHVVQCDQHDACERDHLRGPDGPQHLVEELLLRQPELADLGRARLGTRLLRPPHLDQHLLLRCCCRDAARRELGRSSLRFRQRREPPGSPARRRLPALDHHGADEVTSVEAHLDAVDRR